MPRARAAAVLLLLIAGAAPAHADLAEERETDDAPYTLEPGEVRIGVAKTQVGLFGHGLLRKIHLGTSHLPWALRAFGIDSVNGHGKLELWRDEHFAVSAGVGYTSIRAPIDEATDLRVRVVPVELAAGLDLGRLGIDANLVYTGVQVSGATMDVAPLDELAGLVATRTTQVRATARVRLLDWLGLELGARAVLGQKVRVTARAMERIDDDTVLGSEVWAETAAIDMRGALSGRAALHLSLGALNLKAGVQYGHVNVPMVNVVVPVKSWLPSADLYVRF